MCQPARCALELQASREPINNLAGRVGGNSSQGELRMLGLSFGVGLAYVLCILSAALCVIWGAANWNKGDEPVRQEDVQWAREERKAEEAL